jgi:hypothetical protein
MEFPKQGGRVLSLCYAFAGLETGVLGGLVALAWLVLTSFWQGHSAWAIPALMGSTLGDGGAVGQSFGSIALAGVALQFCAAGILGALFGLAVRERRRFPRLLLLGLLIGLGWFYLLQAMLWRRPWNFVLAPAYSERSMLVACLVFGAFLSTYPRRLQSIRSTFL